MIYSMVRMGTVLTLQLWLCLYAVTAQAQVQVQVQVQVQSQPRASVPAANVEAVPDVMAEVAQGMSNNGPDMAANPQQESESSRESEPEPEVEPEPEPEREASKFSPSPWAVGASIIPGIVIHGAGHFVAGDRVSASRLLAMEGIGLAGLGASLAVLVAVGGSSKPAPLYVPLAVGSIGLLGTSFLADVAGTLNSGRGVWPEPFLLYGFRLRTGYGGLFGSNHRFTHLAQLGAGWHGHRWSLGGDVHVNPGGAYSSYGGQAGCVVWSPGIGNSERSATSPGGSFGGNLAVVDPVTRLTLFIDTRYQDFTKDGFSALAVSGFGELRWNMVNMVPSMGNAWLLGRLGWGMDLLFFDAPVRGDDGLPFLVADVGMGARFFRLLSAEIAWRQRKGELPGGLVTSEGMSGFMGMIELLGRLVLARNWALLPGVRVGNGVFTWLSAEYSFR